MNLYSMLTKDHIIEQLKTVIDPHIGLDIWTLGFIYEITIRDDQHVHILMTLTTPACPLGNELNEMITDALEIIGVEKVEIERTFDPPWQPPEALRRMMGGGI